MKDGPKSRSTATARVVNAFHVALAEELGAEDAGAAQPAKDGEHVHHQDGVGDRGGGNAFCSQRANHDVVQQGNERRNKLLDHDRDQQRQDAPVKLPVSDKFAKHEKRNLDPRKNKEQQPLYMEGMESQGVFFWCRQAFSAGRFMI